MENQFRFYNTLTRKIETVIPHEDGKIKMYTCGPTVYHFAHIGNLRTYIMEDILVRGLSYVGYDVKRVMNITDVGHLSSDADTGEDKMLKGAKREHKTVMEVAKFYADAFFEDCRKLNIKKADVVEPATHCIPEFIHMIEVLLKKGYAYQAGGNVYFDTSRLEDYFVFSSAVEKEQLQVGVRDDVEEDENKRNKNDFVLWFTKSKFEDQALKWDSPCVAFALRDSFEVARSLGIHIARTRICGGGAKSPLWKKIVANVLNIPVDIPENEQGPSMGGAMLAAVACGEYPTVRDAAEAIVKLTDTVEPEPELAAKYEERYQKFRKIYPACRDLFLELAK